MRISFDVSERAWTGYEAFLRTLASRPHVRRVLDIGGGANPALPLDFIESHGLEYVVLDISAEELAKAPDGYSKVQADIVSPNLDIGGSYDLIFSKMVAEHVQSGRDFHSKILSLLSEGGTAFHFFPTLYAPPFVINRPLPERLSGSILLLFQPSRRRESNRAKFPSYYSWCRGLSPRQIDKFRSLGYEVEKYIGFFGYKGYYRRMKPIRELHGRISSILAKHPLPWLTSFAYVVLSKKGNNYGWESYSTSKTDQ